MLSAVEIGGVAVGTEIVAQLAVERLVPIDTVIVTLLVVEKSVLVVVDTAVVTLLVVVRSVPVDTAVVTLLVVVRSVPVDTVTPHS